MKPIYGIAMELSRNSKLNHLSWIFFVQKKRWI